MDMAAQTATTLTKIEYPKITHTAIGRFGKGCPSCNYKSSTSLPGSSKFSFTRTRNVTAP